MGVGHAALPSNVTFSNIHVKIGLVQVQISMRQSALVLRSATVLLNPFLIVSQFDGKINRNHKKKMNGKMSPDVIIEWIEGTKNPNSVKIDIILPSHDYLDQSRDVINLPLVRTNITYSKCTLGTGIFCHVYPVSGEISHQHLLIWQT